MNILDNHRDLLCAPPAQAKKKAVALAAKIKAETGVSNGIAAFYKHLPADFLEEKRKQRIAQTKLPPLASICPHVPLLLSRTSCFPNARRLWRPSSQWPNSIQKCCLVAWRKALLARLITEGSSSVLLVPSQPYC